MTDIAIRVENLSKLYHIGRARQRHDTLRDAVVGTFKRFNVQTFKRANVQPDDTLWALKDVSFEVQRGEVVGVIGRNGAGKSTLLKILSRITEPTAGRAEIHGRVGSLLEVGTGFHPELTGRENIYLNGAILGMKRVEIARKFDEIVAFAEIERFLDTPVKRYSSGMYVRLAFAVAAHLEPEILLVDEVLAVGDASFQKKCLGKMGDVAKEGRTVLFVSHNMAAIENLCQHGLVLYQGHLTLLGSQVEAITHYMKGLTRSMGSLHDRVDRIGSGDIRVVNVEFRDLQGHPLEVIPAGQDVDIWLHYETTHPISSQRVLAGIGVKTQFDTPVFLQHNRLTKDAFGVIPRKGAFVCRIKGLPLSPSIYRLGYSIMPDYGFGGEYFDSMNDAIEFTVIDGDFFGSGEVPPATHGFCLVAASWHVESSYLA